jgi:formate C-acetyltransferase
LSFTPAEGDLASAEDKLIEEITRDKRYYFSTGGGVTLSGGEPFLQNKDALLRLLTRLKSVGIALTAETTLNAPWETVEACIPFIDLFFVDIKAADAVLHKKLTGKDNALIIENLQKLLASGAKIKLRSVVVPGLNDGAENLTALKDFALKFGFEEIELLKYHNMYEDKAKRLGLDVKPLGISPEKSAQALTDAIKLLNGGGFKAWNQELQAAPKPAEFTKRVLDIRDDIHAAKRSLSMEVANLKTKYYKKNKGWKKPTAIHRAERLKYVLENKTVKIYPQELLVGNFTEKRVAGQLWEEQYGVLYASFLPNINKQKPVAFQCSGKEMLDFYFKIMPHWIKHSILVKYHKSISDFILTIARTSDMRVGFNNNFAAIAHYIVNFDRLLSLGTSGMIAEIKKLKVEKPQNNQDEYDGMILCLEGLENFAARYGQLLVAEAEKELKPERRAELLSMAEICAHVPKNPARTFREALQSALFLQIGLCLEAYENAISYGRLDQVLYPYYKKDAEAGIITYDEAKELLALFVLKIDECIIVNDGNGLLSLSRNFETLSIDQSLTFGGLGLDGEDATNDVTYMLVDICELQPLAVNMTARIHKNSPEKYLRRLAEIYVNGCPMPELFSDELYVESLMRRYPDTGIENARNYSIVGCVEPVASNDHFGNTDSANMNLALPFLQALTGQEYELWNISKRQQYEKIYTRVHYHMHKTAKPEHKAAALERRARILDKREEKRGRYIYNAPKSMEELLDRFQKRLNKLAGDILADQQRIEKVLEKDFITPLASSLYPGCLETGKDVYEGGTKYNSSGIQAVGITDVADSLFALNEVVFKNKLFTVEEVLDALRANFTGELGERVYAAVNAVPKFGDDASAEASEWVTLTMEIYNKALASVTNTARGGNCRYTAGYYALNVSDLYGNATGALPSGRKKGVPFANSVTPHYGMQEADLLSALNSMSRVNFIDFAPNGTTATLTIDAALFPGADGVHNLASIFQTYLCESGGMQLQPNVVSRELLIDAYNNPEKHKYLMVRVAGYCAYFQELSDELKKIIINRTCYA